MSPRVPVNPDLLHWALERSGISADALAKKFPKLSNWLGGKLAPTMKQLEAFADSRFSHAVQGTVVPPEHRSVGYHLPLPATSSLVSELPTPSWYGGGYFCSLRLSDGQGA